MWTASWRTLPLGSRRRRKSEKKGAGMSDETEFSIATPDGANQLGIPSARKKSERRGAASGFALSNRLSAGLAAQMGCARFALGRDALTPFPRGARRSAGLVPA